MILSGLLSSMYIWSDKISDIRLSINDIYMTTLMTSWMFFFMGLLNFNKQMLLLSGAAIVIIFICIRNQVFVSRNQFWNGMIPHHSMAVLMSKQLLKNENLNQTEKEFVKNIIITQEKEINWMKKVN